MTRRNALDRLRHNAQDPISTIPLAQGRKRSNRSWDRLHRGVFYFIPPPVREQANDLRVSVLALAQTHATSTSNIASALIGFALTHVRQGKLVIESRPNTSRRKMALTWEEMDGQPRKIPQPVKHSVRDRTKHIYLNHWWGRELDARIKELAGEAVSPGEIVVFLLSYALAAHESGRLILKEETMTVTQNVKPAW